MLESKLVNINTIHPWEKNPKIIRDEKFLQLKRTLLEEGQTLPILVDTRKGNEGCIISGNMRYKALSELVEEKKWDADNIWVYYKETKNDAHLYKLTIQHNMTYGEYVPEQVLELTMLFKDELRLEELDIHLAPPVDLGFHLDNFSEPDTEKDVDTTDDKLDVYLNNEIKQIVLYFQGENYNKVLERLQNIADERGLENNTDVFLALLDYYESKQEGN